MERLEDLILIEDSSTFAKWTLKGKKEYRICATRDTDYIVYRESNIPHCYNKLATFESMEECITFIDEEFVSEIVLIGNVEFYKTRGGDFQTTESDFRIERRNNVNLVFHVVDKKGVNNYIGTSFYFEDIEDAAKFIEVARKMKYDKEILKVV